jgi:lipopolysaccharide/colanic/teichoic acid biosynthesis glycosyltransferase
MKFYLFTKRLFDAVVALVLLILLAPLMIIVAVLVQCTSPGPAIFKQRRYGLNGMTFEIYKFRTMYPNHGQTGDLKSGSLYKQMDDPRVFPLGRLLRRTSIDELPQLFNVLQGTMTLVGPRPLMLFQLDCCPALRDQRSRVKPGMTGLWQIRGRHLNTTAQEMAPYDLAYIARRGWSLDLEILLHTLPVVLKGTGAY